MASRKKAWAEAKAGIHRYIDDLIEGLKQYEAREALRKRRRSRNRHAGVGSRVNESTLA